MAVIAGTRYHYTDSANVGIDMSDTLSMLDPSDVPLLSLIGKDGLLATAVKHEWLENTLRPLDTALDTQGEFSGTGAVTTATVTAGQGVYLRAGDVLKIESELCLLNSISTDTLNILSGGRGYGGSTAASHASSTPIAIIGNVNLTDASLGAARTTSTSGLYNYCQLFEEAVKVTSTSEAIKRWVQTGDLAQQTFETIKVAWMQWERALLHGRKVAPTAGVAGAMDGILVRLTTNVYAKAGAPLIEDYILQMMQDSWTYGGRIDTLVMGGWQKRQFNKFLDSMRQTPRTDRIAGSVIDTYTSDFGVADIVVDRNMPADTVLGLDRKRIKFGPLVGHALQAKPVETNTLLVKAVQIIGQYTSETRNEQAHGKITGLATS